MRREEQLVRECIKALMNEAAKEKVTQILTKDKQTIDWDYVCSYAKKEKVLSFVYKCLKQITLTSKVVPQDIWQRITSYYYTVSTRNLLMADKLKQLIEEFSKVKIDVILLKGLMLNHSLYQDLSLRLADDVDILIKKEDLAAANKILNSLGYLHPPNYTDFEHKKMAVPINALSYLTQTPFPFSIHLHWHLINVTWPLEAWVKKVNMLEIWQRSQPLLIESRQILTLAPDDLLLYLAQHSFNHHFEKLIFAYDIFLVLSQYQKSIDWDFVLAQAKRYDLLDILDYALSFSALELNYDIPQLKRVKEKNKNLTPRVFSFLISNGLRSYKLSYLVYLLKQKCLKEKLGFLLRTAFPSKYVMAHNLNLCVSEIRLGHYRKRLINNLLH